MRIDEESDDVEARVVITLEWNDGEYLGAATGAPDANARARLLGEATLRAVQALAPKLELGLEAIATTNLGGSSIAMAQVEVARESLMVGSAFFQGDNPSAAPVRAVLDAINRRLVLEL